MDSHSKIEAVGKGDCDEELMAELEREVARNNEAVRLVKEKELQALAARDRAADSQRRMHEMMNKYEEMKQKLELTRLTLEHTASQINKHDIRRADQIRDTVTRLKEKAANCSEILRKKREREEKKISSILSGDMAEIDQIATAPLEDDSSLTEAEKMLLLICQTEASANKTENEIVTGIIKEEEKQNIVQINEQLQADSRSPTEHSINTAPVYDDSSLTEAEKMLLLICQTEAAENRKENESEAEVLEEEPKQHCVQIENDIQSDSNSLTEPSINCTAEKEIPKSENENSSDTITTFKSSSAPDICNEILSLNESKESDHEHVDKEHQKDNTDVGSEPIIEDALNNIDVAAHKAPSITKVGGAEASDDFDLKEITKDLSKTVTTIEAKCAGVREELGQMAMSEQYMRTKQAQLLAKRREKEAERAVEMASKKEQEAQDMRRKVANMMKLLEERKNKLKVTENVLEKRTNVVDKVNKVLDSKLRKANFVQQQRDECVAFDKSHKKSKSDKKQDNIDEQSDSEEKEIVESTTVDEEANKANDSDEKEVVESTKVEQEEHRDKEDDKV